MYNVCNIHDTIYFSTLYSLSIYYIEDIYVCVSIYTYYIEIIKMSYLRSVSKTHNPEESFKPITLEMID